VTRKIVSHAVRIKLELADRLALGNLEARRDWGHARDYVEAMWLMLQQDEPEDYVIASGVTHSVRELVETAFDLVGLDYRSYVEVDEKLYWPSEPYQLVGDASKAHRQLAWFPKVSFEDLIREMLVSEFQHLNRLETITRPEVGPEGILAAPGLLTRS